MSIQMPVPGAPILSPNPAASGETVTARWARAPESSLYRLDLDGVAVWTGTETVCRVPAVPGVYTARAWNSHGFGPPSPGQELWTQPAELFRITDIEWWGIIKRLVAYARVCVRQRPWNTPTGRPEARTIEDLVDEVIIKLFSRPPEPRWDQARGPLEPLLRRALRFDILNLARGADTRRRVLDREGTLLDSLPKAGPSPEEECVEKERDDAIADLFSRIRELLATDAHLLAVFDLTLEGLKSADIAEVQDVPVKEVYRATRTLKRRLKARFGDEVRKLLDAEENNEEEPNGGDTDGKGVAEDKQNEAKCLADGEAEEDDE